MLVELHIIQNFASSNLNRDESGAPKDCEFGGYRRARISSQCIKRAIRGCFRDERLLDEEHLAKRTKRLLDQLAGQLVGRGRDPDLVHNVVMAALKGMRFGFDKEGKTEYLLFLGAAEIDALAKACDEHWNALVDSVEAGSTARAKAGERQSARGVKQAGQQAIPDEVRGALEKVLDGGKAADLALFGRMLADRPEKNVDAACQVAHAVSTNRVSVEFDFYTAVDDLKPDDTAGADMLGTVEFNSACYYRYANVDLEQLKQNLGGDEDLTRRTLEAFVRASIDAVPTGKQNSMAAQNPPSFVLAVARERRLWSLANAFVQPVRPDGNGDLVQNSVRALDAYWGQLARMYGENGIVGKWCAMLDGDGLTHLARYQVDGVEAVIAGLLAAVKFESED